MSSQVRFYQLSTTPLVRALGELVGKAVSQGHKALIATATADQAKTLDDGLWTWKQDNFLPHGVTGDPDPALTPVWISAQQAEWEKAPNNAGMLVITYGADADGPYDLICDMFDGSDADQLANARSRYRTAKDAGKTVTYYQQTASGGWEQKN